ncbi:MAG: hypothetical protein ABL986_18270 [Vicinamibacterales bacterium]
MKSVLVSIVLVIVLIAAAEAFRRAAAIEDALAVADEQLTTSGAASRDTDEALDNALALAARVPVLGPRLQQDVRQNRAAQAYWQGEYAALVSGPLAPAATDNDPTLQLLSANAAFRQAVMRAGTPQVLARGLDEVLKGYGAALDKAPGNVDAAYNYEFVARLRSALAGGRASGMPEPEERNMQGEPGEPPKGTPKSDFNVIVPMRPEERQEQLDPGTGAEFKRRG